MVFTHIKRTKHFLSEAKELDQLPEGTILCTIHVLDLYPDISHDESFALFKDFLDSRVRNSSQLIL